MIKKNLILILLLIIGNELFSQSIEIKQNPKTTINKGVSKKTTQQSNSKQRLSEQKLLKMASKDYNNEVKELTISEPRKSLYETETWILSKLRELTPLGGFYEDAWHLTTYVKNVTYDIENSNLVIKYAQTEPCYHCVIDREKTTNYTKYIHLSDIKVERGSGNGETIDFYSKQGMVTVKNNSSRSVEYRFHSTIKINSDRNLIERLNNAFDNLKYYYPRYSNNETF
jgi:hypothetical protein